MQTTFDEKIFTLPCEEFYFTVASNPQLLQKGYEIVYKYLSLSPQNREQTLLHLLSEKAPVLTLVTRTYPIVYADQTVGITAEQKMKTKEYLIAQVLLKKLVCNFGKQPFANKKNLSNFLLFLIHFHNNEGFEGWVGCYEKLLEQLIKISSDLIGFILIEILKSSDDRVSCFSKHILPFVINNQTNLKISEQDSLQIIYYCIKSMAYMNGTQDDVLQQYFEPYEQKILEYIFTSISKSIKIMKFSLKILTVFVADYEIQLEKQMIVKLKQCSKQLAAEHLASRLQQSASEDLDDEEQDEQSSASLSIIIYQLIELFETLLSCEQMKMADYELYLSLCLPSLLLSKADYINYRDSTETYLADIQDESQKNLRNKVVSFLIQLYQGQYPAKTKGKMQTEVLKYTLILHLKSVSQEKFGQELINFFSNISLPIQIQKQHLPLFEQSLTFLLYHLTEEILTFDAKNLQQNKQSLMMSLGKNLELSSLSNDLVIKVSYMNLLNKLIKSMNKSVKEAFYVFLVESFSKITDFQKEKGFLLSVCRGIAYVSNDVTIGIVQQQGTDKGIPIIMLQNLIKYLLDQNTLQQSAHLILQFFLTLLKQTPSSLTVLKSLVPAQVQIHILSTFVHDGTIADVVVDLLSEIGSQEFINYIYGEFVKGFAKEQNLVLLISKWVKLQSLRLTENELKFLLKAYQSQFVSKIIKEYLCLTQKQKTSHNLSTQMVTILNDNIHPSWILPMIGCNILRNPQALLLNTIQTITYQLTSQFQIQNQLLLPYYTFINDPRVGVSIIKSKSSQLYEDFLNKLIRYAALFQGPNLKVITSHVLLNICQVDPHQIKPVFQLIASYGKTTETDEWEDEERDPESVIDRMFNMKLTNDEVENEFAQIFGNIVYDMALVNAKVDQLSAMIKQ